MGRKVCETCFGAMLHSQTTLLDCIVYFLGIAFGTLLLDTPYRRVDRTDLCEGMDKGREHVPWPQGSQGLCGWRADGARG